MFKKILIANRGEIAVRVIRACRELGISPVAVYSEADRDALHVQMADAAIAIGPAPARESYLAIDKVIAAARSAGVEAIHPGYGFLSENPEFARAVGDAGLVFIGPSPETLELSGDKVRARKAAAANGAPVLPAIEDLTVARGDAARAAQTLGLPLLVKAAAGGGGKGMRVVRDAGELPAALAAAEREALSAFGDGRVFLERLVERPRHVEVQVLGDRHGNLIHLGERECSLQRRHQKIVEEAPSAAVDDALRDRLTQAALMAARAVGYSNAGTVEFLLAPDGEFYFLEINPRLQVEHPVTECVTGVDLVVAQIRVAAGERLPIRQEDVELRGHAIECRLYAEDPSNRFLPSSGKIAAVSLPSGPGVRIDSALWAGATISIDYDPLLAKIIAFAPDREQARRRMLAAFDEFLLVGPANNLTFLRSLMELDEFREARIDTQLIEREA
ncbi:MAG: acetyl-CoA carboxylase, biotin carboxylase subunit, partial [Candidatus Binatota bacterium]|nr:acetyl-CoA carboxylase, biotin carboxylase subunit [Candidatus Binatota bacterium]